MKVFYKAPTDKVLIVKPDSETEDYEIYLIRPVLIGHASMIGDRRIAVGRNLFSTLKAAAMHLLEARGEKELADQLHTWRAKSSVVEITGLQMVKEGDWAKYCKDQQIPEEEFLRAPDKKYSLSAKDAKTFGLKTKSN